MLNDSDDAFFFRASGDSGSRVHGFLHDRIFEGKIYTSRGQEFHIEPAWKFFNDSTFHSVIYSADNIRYPHPHGAGCGIKKELKDWMRRIQTSHVTDEQKDANLKHADDEKIANVRVKRASADKTSCRLFVQVGGCFFGLFFLF